MPKIRLTKKAIDGLRAPTKSGKQALYWDTRLRGFGVLCSGVTNSKSFVVQRDLPDGRARRVTLAPTNVIGLEEARRRAEAKLAELYSGVDPKAAARERTTLREILEDYIASRPSLRATSIEEYRRGVTGHLAAWLDRPLREITSEMVETRHRKIAAEIAARGRYSGAATANGVMRALRVLWNFAEDRITDLPKNPVARLRRQWFPVARRETLVHADDMPRFYGAVRELPNAVARDYLLLLLFTGLRRGEAARLRWSDVDLSQRVIRIPAASTKAGRKLDLPMSDFVHDLLVARGAIGREVFVFPASSRSKHIEEPKFAFDLVAAASGIRVSAHDLRRTYVTAAESADISPLALKALVNHSLGSTDVTAGYVVMNAERLREPAQRVCDKLKSLCGISAVESEKVKKLSR